jgi:hypothetical protein
MPWCRQSSRGILTDDEQSKGHALLPSEGSSMASLSSQLDVFYSSKKIWTLQQPKQQSSALSATEASKRRLLLLLCQK